jgi:TldD protein
MLLKAVLPMSRRTRQRLPASTAARVERQATTLDPAPLLALAQRAVEAAQRAGASYADARLTRSVQHRYFLRGLGEFWWEEELIGVGVRALMNGAWGFAASATWDTDEVARLAHDAVTQAKANAVGGSPPIELAPVPVATGTWTTPIQIDPFTVPIEEKFDAIVYWKACAQAAGIPFQNNGYGARFGCVRQEQVLVTSEGTRVSQTRYEIGGQMVMLVGRTPVLLKPLDFVGAGWEYLRNLPDRFPAMIDEARRQQNDGAFTPLQVGRYTLVCDGAAIANVLDKTLGMATQLDRALGYEANAGGTSYLDDPLGMAGHFQVASPLVTVTSNRSAPTQLATVKWDDEGVEPVDATLVKDGMLTDFQTTREGAPMLAPYYRTAGRPVRSNGYAASEDALSITMQHMPNLALAPGAPAMSLDAMIANVPKGILVEGVQGQGVQMDFQQRNGMLFPERLREITNGRIGRDIPRGSIYFNSIDFWKSVTAVGGASTQGTFHISQYGIRTDDMKGEPIQRTSHTVVAPAATVAKQILLDPMRKA